MDLEWGRGVGEGEETDYWPLLHAAPSAAMSLYMHMPIPCMLLSTYRRCRLV